MVHGLVGTCSQDLQSATDNNDNNNNDFFYANILSQRSSSVARQNQGIKQTRF